MTHRINLWTFDGYNPARCWHGRLNFRWGNWWFWHAIGIWVPVRICSLRLLWFGATPIFCWSWNCCGGGARSASARGDLLLPNCNHILYRRSTGGIRCLSHQAKCPPQPRSRHTSFRENPRQSKGVPWRNQIEIKKTNHRGTGSVRRSGHAWSVIHTGI